VKNVTVIKHPLVLHMYHLPGLGDAGDRLFGV
jgi:uracil phosphoribosyltransferase